MQSKGTDFSEVCDGFNTVSFWVGVESKGRPQQQKETLEGGRIKVEKDLLPVLFAIWASEWYKRKFEC